jgi:hypothetical protein
MMSLLAFIPRDPVHLITVSLCIVGLFLATIFLTAFKPKDKSEGELSTFQAYLKFCYACFVKPHTGDGTGSQQDALVRNLGQDGNDMCLLAAGKLLQGPSRRIRCYANTASPWSRGHVGIGGSTAQAPR